MLLGQVHSLTQSTFDCSICTVPPPTRTPRKSRWSCSNTHFSGFKCKSFVLSHSSTRRTSFRCCSTCSSSLSHGLEGGGRVGEAEKHDHWLIEPLVGDKRCLPPILWFD